MTCLRGAVDDIYFVKWIVPETSDVAAILEDVATLRETLAKPPKCITIVGSEIDPPGEDVRGAMRKNFDDLLRYCASVHLVVEGKGFRRAMLRNIGTSIFLLSKNRGRAFAHDTVEQALERIGLAAPQVSDVLQQAHARELLNVAPRST